MSRFLSVSLPVLIVDWFDLFYRLVGNSQRRAAQPKVRADDLWIVHDDAKTTMESSLTKALH